jgi:hypothetical protein
VFWFAEPHPPPHRGGVDHRQERNPRAVDHPDLMPGRGTPHAGIRVPEALWQRFAELAEQVGTDRSTLLRAWIRWYVGEPGAVAPKRPRER